MPPTHLPLGVTVSLDDLVDDTSPPSTPLASSRGKAQSYNELHAHTGVCVCVCVCVFVFVWYGSHCSSLDYSLPYFPCLPRTDFICGKTVRKLSRVNHSLYLYRIAPNRKTDHLHFRAGASTAPLSSFSARKPNIPYESTKKESAAQSMINLSMAIGGGVGGLAKEGTDFFCPFPLHNKYSRS
jgi:hypothetical protein